jgi:hypothetical protein
VTWEVLGTFIVADSFPQLGRVEMETEAKLELEHWALTCAAPAKPVNSRKNKILLIVNH